ncbi:MAG: metal-sensing transcriptional repressor [Selenomonadaceae bacterium]|nr:metal-sensing transcriptional repressor [Selenomonadaceae bacterium]
MTPEEHAKAHALGLPHDHDHAHGHHGHTHSHTQTKAVLNRMSRLIGHLEKVKRMVEAGEDCSDVLIQLSAVDSALKGVGRLILKDHISHCIVDAARDDDAVAIEKLNKAIDQFLK